MPPSGSAASTAQHDGARKAIGGGAAEPRQYRRVDRRADASRQCEYGVAVEWRVNRTDRAGETVLRHDRQAPASALIECRVSGDNRNRRADARDTGPTLREVFQIERCLGDRRLPGDLTGERQIGCPQTPTIRSHRGTPAVHRNDRTDNGTAGKNERGAANPALQPAALGAEPGPGIAEPEVLARRGDSLATKRSVGRLAGPRSPAREAEIEQDRGGDDRHNRRADRKAAAACLGEPIHDPGSSIEPKGRAAGQHNRVDMVDQGARTEQLGLATARRPTADID
jgi:hypothetical protein